jgi:hypothetical protein
MRLNDASGGRRSSPPALSRSPPPSVPHVPSPPPGLSPPPPSSIVPPSSSKSGRGSILRAPSKQQPNSQLVPSSSRRPTPLKGASQISRRGQQQQMKAASSSTSSSITTSSPPTNTSSSSSGDMVYEMKKILESGVDKTTGKPIYLVWWEQYRRADATWEMEENIDGQAVKSFIKSCHRSNKHADRQTIPI